MPSSFIVPNRGAISAGDLVEDTDVLRRNFIMRKKKLADHISAMRDKYTALLQDGRRNGDRRPVEVDRRSDTPQTTENNDAAAAFADSLKCALCLDTMCAPVIKTPKALKRYEIMEAVWTPRIAKYLQVHSWGYMNGADYIG
ncbi:hypothetical protein M422DRAFT_255253 [Sphaerobolus stellatus SS14]|uniref:Uncharacterized protein n=1 Tax=Sphaerobolus stellatus (strain SS14) TaxID=990650 RepID=A0A0C9VT12_SPHS4|nr:hypothetical protein M422DRAFT_255253 [Sphaerobolus stellatus SS14]